MTNWQPKTIDEALTDAIGSAINDNIQFEDLGGDDAGPEYVDPDNIDKIVEQAIKNILGSEFIKVKFKRGKASRLKEFFWDRVGLFAEVLHLKRLEVFALWRWAHYMKRTTSK